MKEDHVYAIAFADDLALLSSSADSLSRKLSKLEEELRKFGMEINAEKTEFMQFVPEEMSRASVTPQFHVNEFDFRCYIRPY